MGVMKDKDLVVKKGVCAKGENVVPSYLKTAGKIAGGVGLCCAAAYAAFSYGEQFLHEDGYKDENGINNGFGNGTNVGDNEISAGFLGNTTISPQNPQNFDRVAYDFSPKPVPFPFNVIPSFMGLAATALSVYHYLKPFKSNNITECLDKLYEVAKDLREFFPAIKFLVNEECKKDEAETLKDLNLVINYIGTKEVRRAFIMKYGDALVRLYDIKEIWEEENKGAVKKFALQKYTDCEYEDCEFHRDFVELTEAYSKKNRLYKEFLDAKRESLEPQCEFLEDPEN